ncbi:SDR family NAD(P)-dependent oxidoreductase [Mameliella sp.]|uniref:SDR family NAD(P)-dependent oxidoreductase n=1 Tax=Mameliella sp. TaxID=1924940 RepID=UPI003BA96BB5
MNTVVITGASRGLGAEFCRQYAAEGWTVIGGCRDPQGADLPDTVRLLPLDVEEAGAVRAFAVALAGRPVDVLINNAGIMGDPAASALAANADEWDRAFRINVRGPALVTRALLANLKAASRPVAVTMGSEAGIFDRIDSAQLAIYRSTKAAAHAVTRSLGHALKDEGVLYYSLRPGRTRTDMTGGEGDHTAADSVARMRDVIANAREDWRGLFIDRSGVVYDYGGGFAG